MAQLTNSPDEVTILRLKARKSFALGIFIADQNDHLLDITGATLRLVVRKPTIPSTVTDDSANLIVNSVATLTDPLKGYATFHLQAAELEDAPGEYAYSITLVHQGYSSVIVEGPLELEQNTEFTSTTETYSTTGPPQALRVLMREQRAVRVKVGYALAPGTQSFTDADSAKLDGIQPGAEVNVNADWLSESGDSQIYNRPTTLLPPGGFPREVVTKVSGADQDAVWSMPTVGGTSDSIFIEEDPLDPLTAFPDDSQGLDATGVDAGLTPVTDGLDSWSWQPVAGGVVSVNGKTGLVVLTMDDIADGATRLALTPAERAAIATIDATPDWSVITNKPAFGSAALAATTDFLPATGIDASKIISGIIAVARIPRVGELLGQSVGQTVPTGGVDGDEYFQYS